METKTYEQLIQEESAARENLLNARRARFAADVQYGIQNNPPNNEVQIIGGLTAFPEDMGFQLTEIETVAKAVAPGQEFGPAEARGIRDTLYESGALAYQQADPGEGRGNGYVLEPEFRKEVREAAQETGLLATAAQALADSAMELAERVADTKPQTAQFWGARALIIEEENQ